MITWNDVLSVASGLDSLSSRAQETILDIVSRQVNATAWGDRANDGMIMLAAHLGTVAKRQGVGGPVTSEKLGEMARSYGFMGGRSALSTTAYGMEFERMVRLLPRAVGIAI